MNDLSIVTYGGGEILKSVFEAISQLMSNGQQGMVWPFAIIAVSIGGVWAIAKAFFSSNIDALFTHYILPLIAIPTLLMIPTSSVKIEDVLKDVSYKIDHVPLFLARMAELVSSIGYNLTVAMEAVMHTPDDTGYNQTGMLFGAETVLDISKFKVTNANLEQNLVKFTNQCVLYDLALGKYSIDELKKSTDLLTFLKNNTSKVRMIRYFDPHGEGSKNGKYMTCQETLAEITPLLEKERAYFSQHELLKHLPLTYQVLTGIKKDNEELIGQQIMMSALSKGMTSSNIAKARAESHQKNTYQVMGSMASTNLITMRIVLEALIYSSFILVIPLSLIPGGIKFILSWIWLSVWIQLWPPFYAILNYIMQVAAKSFATSLMFGLSSDQLGLSLFTSAGLQNLHENISATAGYLSLSIPFISYTILQGAQSFVHLAGTLAAPAQSAATTSAAEMTSGNYSFANTNFGQMSYQNTSALQSNSAPTLSCGFMTETHGNYAITHAMDGTSVVKQNDSTLISSLSSDQAISESLQKSYQTAETHVNSAQQNYSEALSKSSRSMEDLTHHLGKSSSYVEGFSERESSAIQESCGYIKNTAENFATQHGISASQAYDMLVSGAASASIGLNLFGTGGAATIGNHHNFSHGVGSSDALNAAISLSSSEDFQKHFNNISEFSKNNAHSLVDDQGIRAVSGFTESLDTLKSSQQNYQNAYNEMTQASQNLNWAESNSHQIRRSLNQSFVDWSKEQVGYGKTIEMLQSKSPEERERLMSDFLNQHISHARNESTDPLLSFENTKLSTLNWDQEATAMTARAGAQVQEHHLIHSTAQEDLQSLQSRLNLSQSDVSQKIESQENIHASKYKTIGTDFDSKRNEQRITRMKEELYSENALSQNFKTYSTPLWLQE